MRLSIHTSESKSAAAARSENTASAADAPTNVSEKKCSEWAHAPPAYGSAAAGIWPCGGAGAGGIGGAWRGGSCIGGGGRWWW